MKGFNLQTQQEQKPPHQWLQNGTKMKAVPGGSAAQQPFEGQDCLQCKDGENKVENSENEMQ